MVAHHHAPSAPQCPWRDRDSGLAGAGDDTKDHPNKVTRISHDDRRKDRWTRGVNYIQAGAGARPTDRRMFPWVECPDSFGPRLDRVWAILDASVRFRPRQTHNMLRWPGPGRRRPDPGRGEKGRPPGIFAAPPPARGAGTHTYPLSPAMRFPRIGPLASRLIRGLWVWCCGVCRGGVVPFWVRPGVRGVLISADVVVFMV